MDIYFPKFVRFDPAERELLTEAACAHPVLTRQRKGWTEEHFNTLISGLSQDQHADCLNNWRSALLSLMSELRRDAERWSEEEVDAPMEGGPFIKSPKGVAFLFKDLRLHQIRICEEALTLIDVAKTAVREANVVPYGEPNVRS